VANDKNTVSFLMDQPNANILDFFDLMFIMDKDMEKDIKTKGGGTGAFKLKTWTGGDKFVVERTPTTGSRPALPRRHRGFGHSDASSFRSI